jgi:hypothetical protein
MVNVSSTGLQFVSSQAYRLGEIVAVEIDVSSGATLGAVMCITREVPGSSRVHTYGARFVEFKDHGRQLLNETLAAIWQRRSVNTTAASVPASPAAAVSEPMPPLDQTPPQPDNDRRWGPTIKESPDIPRGTQH